MSADCFHVEGSSLRGTSGAPTSRKSGTLETPTFAMIPEAVLVDSALKNIDVRVFGLLACARRKQFATVGERLLASRLGVDRRTVRASITRLTASAHLKLTEPNAPGRRARYELTSPAFAGKASASAPTAPALSQRIRPALKCAKCHAPTRWLAKTGWCRSCMSELKVRRIVRDELRATA